MHADIEDIQHGNEETHGAMRKLIDTLRFFPQAFFHLCLSACICG